MHGLLRSSALQCRECCLTPRSRRGPTSKRQAREAAQAIIRIAGLAFCCRSHLSSNVRPHNMTSRRQSAHFGNPARQDLTPEGANLGRSKLRFPGRVVRAGRAVAELPQSCKENFGKPSGLHESHSAWSALTSVGVRGKQ